MSNPLIGKRILIAATTCALLLMCYIGGYLLFRRAFDLAGAMPETHSWDGHATFVLETSATERSAKYVFYPLIIADSQFTGRPFLSVTDGASTTLCVKNGVSEW